MDGLHRVLRMSVEAGRPDAVEVVQEELARRGVASEPGPVRAIGQVARSTPARPARNVPGRKPRATPPSTGGPDAEDVVDLLSDLLDALTDHLTDD